jgi:hypothetical protein
MLDWLSDCKLNIYSQFGEDGIVDAILDVIGTTNRWCLDVGAADGLFLSNTRRLIKALRWRAVLIESDYDKYKQLCERSNEAICINAFVEPTGPNSLDAILARTEAPKIFDVVSIDIDGADYAVWENMHNYIGRVVIIEHAYKGTDVTLGQAPPFAMAELANRKGYEVVCRTECNSICVLKDLVKGLLDVDTGRNSKSK